MRDVSQDNAMTEIALALATGFFSIMVLTMVSMGAGFRDTEPAAAMVLAPAASAATDTATVRPDEKDIIIYYQGRFLGTDLKTIDPTGFQPVKTAVLAVDPSLPVAEVMAARAKIAVSNLVVSSLDERWLRRLKGAGDERR